MFKDFGINNTSVIHKHNFVKLKIITFTTIKSTVLANHVHTDHTQYGLLNQIINCFNVKLTTFVTHVQLLSIYNRRADD